MKLIFNYFFSGQNVVNDFQKCKWMLLERRFNTPFLLRRLLTHDITDLKSVKRSHYMKGRKNRRNKERAWMRLSELWPVTEWHLHEIREPCWQHHYNRERLGLNIGSQHAPALHQQRCANQECLFEINKLTHIWGEQLTITSISCV